jgi:hypothetical protein
MPNFTCQLGLPADTQTHEHPAHIAKHNHTKPSKHRFGCFLCATTDVLSRDCDIVNASAWSQSCGASGESCLTRSTQP